MNNDKLKIFLNKSPKVINNEKLFIRSKIDNWLAKIDTSLISENEKIKKRKELIDLGKFIYCFNDEIEIIDGNRESPDFIVLFKDNYIGIELTDLISKEEEKRKEGLLRKIFKQIENELKKESDKYNGIYRIGFINNLSYTPKIQKELKSEIIDLIKGKIVSGKIVNEFRKTNHSKISIYNSEGYEVGPLERITIENIILKKGKKIIDYSSANIKAIWLLLVIVGIDASDDYSFIKKDILKIPFSTKFERIFILNCINSELYELQTTK